MKFHVIGRRWVREFLIGPYRGAPIDFVMAIIIIWAMMFATVIGMIRAFFAV